MTPAEVVRGFAILTAQCLDALMITFEGIEKRAVAEGALLLRRDGSGPARSGRLEPLGRYVLHGRGCRFELDSGEDLDVDWDSDGRAIFDTWRMLMFARSIHANSVDRESLRLAAIDDPLLWHVKDDWFTWADRNYDLRKSRA